MNGLEEIQTYIEKCLQEKEEVQQTIRNIEERRMQLAHKRNEKKAINCNDGEVNELGMEISKLGNQSQELQNKLDSNWYAIKLQVNLMMDNLIVENMRKFRIISEEVRELEERKAKIKDRIERYDLQKQEFYLRFGRMPELSGIAKKESESQEKQIIEIRLQINEMAQKMGKTGKEVFELEFIKNQFKKGNWNIILEEVDNKKVTIEDVIEQETAIIAELHKVTIEDVIAQETALIAELQRVTIEDVIAQETALIAELQRVTIEDVIAQEIALITELQKVTIEDVIAQEIALIAELQKVTIEDVIAQETALIAELQEIGNIAELQIEDLYIEDFVPIEEIAIEEFELEDIVVDAFKPVEQISEIDEIEELARAIVEEIATEQANYNINKVEEDKDETAEIIFEKEENEPKSKVIIPLFGQKATISTIVVKFDEGELVYKAQMSDNEIIKLYPSKLGQKSVLLRDKQNREECRDILNNYAVREYKVFDKKVVNKIDPLVCELLIECAEKYNFNAQELIYNYAMSFEQGESDLVPDIIYNISFIEESNLSTTEKSIMKKICRNARKNNNIEIIESFTAFKKLKYILRRVFAINNVNLLTDGNVDEN